LSLAAEFTELIRVVVFSPTDDTGKEPPDKRLFSFAAHFTVRETKPCVRWAWISWTKSC